MLKHLHLMADDDKNSKKKTAVYITLVSIGVVLTTLFVMMLSINVKIFILLIILYLIAFSIYNFVYLMMNKKLLDKDVRYDVAMYTSLFNIFFGASIFLLTIVLWVVGLKTSNSYSFSTPSRYY